MKSRKVIGMAAVVMVTTLLVGCQALLQGSNSIKTIENQQVARSDTTFMAQDTAILVKKDLDSNQLEFQTLVDGSRYSLSYDGTTTFYTQYDEAVSVAQLMCGSVVTNQFNSKSTVLKNSKLFSECTYLKNVSEYTLDKANKKINIYGTEYEISKNKVFISEDKEIELDEIEQVDVLSVWIYKNLVVSVNVEKGHGYLSLKNDDYFIGGWIEAGDRLVTTIKKDMKLVIPEGKAKIIVSKGRTKIFQEIDFVRNEEMVWDLSNVSIVEEKKPEKKSESTREEETTTEETTQEETAGEEETSEEETTEENHDTAKESSSSFEESSAEEKSDTDDTNSSSTV